MNVSDEGLKFIAGHEGMVLKPYNDPSNFCTIGIGHLIGRRPCNQSDYSQWGTLTEQEAYDLFRSDARRFIDAVNDLVNVKLTQNQFDALVSFSFNVGEGNFSRSTLLKKLNAGDYQGAADEFPRWNKSAGRTLRGLTRRRKEERELFLKPDSGKAKAPPVQSVPRVPGESKEVAAQRQYMANSGIPHRVTSTVRSKAPSRHAQQGTDGRGLATDFAGPKPSRNSPELLAIFKAFEPVEDQLYELIYSGADYSIKRGKRVPRYAIGGHWDHVHVATNKGVLIQWPGSAQGLEEEDDEMIKYGLIQPKGGGPTFGVYVVPETIKVGKQTILPGRAAKVGFTNAGVLAALRRAGNVPSNEIEELEPADWERIPHVGNI